MLSSRRAAAAAAFLAALPAWVLAADGPNLGVVVSPAEIAAWDISVGPDGAGLPSGSGNAAQGATVYREKCHACHGEKGAGQVADRLVGGFGTITGTKPAIKTIGSYWPYSTTLFDYVRRAMPLLQPQSLTNEQVYAVTAYLLNLNGVIGNREVMDARTLPRVKMPGRDRFFVAYPGNLE